jgi:hypothetical protein
MKTKIKVCSDKTLGESILSSVDRMESDYLRLRKKQGYDKTEQDTLNTKKRLEV